MTKSQKLLRYFAVADWLDAKRARGWCLVLAVVLAIGTIGYLLSLRHDIDPLGKPVGTDFVSFWTASLQMRAGFDTAIYNPAAHKQAEMTLFADARPDYYGFFYPPVFALMCRPLAYASYPVALVAWLIVGFLPLFFCLRRILPASWALLPILSYPAWLVNAGHGQNGCLSAALVGLFMLSERVPVLGGAWLGVLVFKPQLAVAVPVALLAARRWRAALGGFVVALGLVLLSFWMFGPSIWTAFFASNELARRVLEQGLVDPAKMVSVFAALRLLDAPLWLAFGAQSAVALVVLGVLARVACNRPGVMAEGAMLATGVCLCTPFLLDYDLCLLALPMAFVCREAVRTGWLPWEKIVLLAAYLTPLLARSVAMATGIGVAPMIVAALFWVVARRSGTSDYT